MKLIQLITIAVVSVGLISCTTKMHPEIEKADVALMKLKEGTDVEHNAPRALKEAEHAVRRAERDWRKNEDDTEAMHLSYIAGQRIKIAHIKNSQEIAEIEAQRLLRSKDKILLDARTREAAAWKASALKSSEQLALLQGARETARGIQLTLSDVLFEVDKAILKPGARLRLEPLASFLINHPDQIVTIEGHTDSQGANSYNEQLSKRRADAVKRMLVGMNIGNGRIITKGMGEQYPRASNNTEAGRLENRRVEIIISGSPEANKS